MAETRNATVDYVAVERAKPTLAQLAAYSGTYYSPELDVAHGVNVKEGRLMGGRWPGATLAAEPTFADAMVCACSSRSPRSARVESTSLYCWPAALRLAA